MENENTLDYLLQIESKAASLVSDAQEEADRRLHESEEKNHTAYDESYKAQVQRLETLLQESKEKINSQYNEELEKYRREISCLNINTERFSMLLNEYLAED